MAQINGAEERADLGRRLLEVSMNADATRSQANRAAPQAAPAVPIAVRRLYNFGI